MDGGRGRGRVALGRSAVVRGVRTRGGVRARLPERPSLSEALFSGTVATLPEGQPSELPINYKRVRVLPAVVAEDPMMESRLRASPEQFAALLDFMERHGDLSRPQVGPKGRIKADNLWQELVDLLNSIGGGVVKLIEKWKKVWADWKTKTKKKALALHREGHGTGGGPSSRQALTALEQRLLSIMGLSAVVGLTGIEERGFDDPPCQRDANHPSQSQATPVDELIMDLISSNAVNFTGTSASPSLLQAPAPVTTASTPAPFSVHMSPPVASMSPPIASMSQDSQQRRRRRSPAPLASLTGSTPKRRLRLHRCRTQTSFKRATDSFVAVEKRRLQLEEDRERNRHLIELEKLKNETKRLEIEDQRNIILTEIARSLTVIATTSASLPSTDVLL